MAKTPNSWTKRPSRRRAPQPIAAEPTTDAIAQRAFAIFVARGGEHGHDREDWTRAEQELRAAV
jgi:hypothetical protein